MFSPRLLSHWNRVSFIHSKCFHTIVPSFCIFFGLNLFITRRLSFYFTLCKPFYLVHINMQHDNFTRFSFRISIFFSKQKKIKKQNQIALQFIIFWDFLNKIEINQRSYHDLSHSLRDSCWESKLTWVWSWHHIGTNSYWNTNASFSFCSTGIVMRRFRILKCSLYFLGIFWCFFFYWCYCLSFLFKYVVVNLIY